MLRLLGGEKVRGHGHSFLVDYTNVTGRQTAQTPHHGMSKEINLYNRLIACTLGDKLTWYYVHVAITVHYVMFAVTPLFGLATAF